MGFWEGKCFYCLMTAALAVIAGLSINTEVKEQKRLKRIEHIKSQYQDTL